MPVNELSRPLLMLNGKPLCQVTNELSIEPLTMPVKTRVQRKKDFEQGRSTDKHIPLGEEIFSISEAIDIQHRDHRRAE
jgi:hypothetical protein